MVDITYHYATKEQIALLVDLRIKELAMFSEVPFTKENKEQIAIFYKKKMEQDMCFTILGYDGKELIATGTIYFYDTLPSNTNPSGKMGCITNIWTESKYRKRHIATEVVEQLLELAKNRCGMVCLNAAIEAKGLYQRVGFIQNEKAMVYTWKH